MSIYWQAIRKPITEDLTGRILSTSYGYDMTINKYVKVLRQTQSSLVVQPVGCHVENDNGSGHGQSTPSGFQADQPTFSLSLWEHGPTEAYRQKYPTSENKPQSYFKGKGRTWRMWDGKPDYYNTWD